MTVTIERREFLAAVGGAAIAWPPVHFDRREDPVKTLKVGNRFDVRIPALGDRRITVEVKLIATKGEHASWRVARATGDFDLRTFSIRAYPVEKVPELRPGMSAYMDWQQRR